MKPIVYLMVCLAFISASCTSKTAPEATLAGTYHPNMAAEAVFSQIQKNEMDPAIFDTTLTADELEGILLSSQTCPLYSDKKIPLLGPCPPLAELLKPTDPPRLFQVTPEQRTRLSKRLIQHSDERVRATAITYLLSDTAIPTPLLARYLMEHEDSPLVHLTTLRYLTAAPDPTVMARYASADMKPYLTFLESSSHPLIRAMAAERDMTVEEIVRTTPNTIQGMTAIIREPGYVTDKESEALISLLSRCTLDDAIQLDTAQCYAYQVMQNLPKDSERILPDLQMQKFERLLSNPSPLVRAFTMSSFATTALTSNDSAAVPLALILQKLREETSSKAILYTMSALEMFKDDPSVKAAMESFMTHPNMLVSRTALQMYASPKAAFSAEEMEKRLLALQACPPDEHLNLPTDCEAMNDFKQAHRDIAPETALPVYQKQLTSDDETIRAIAYYATISALVTLDTTEELPGIVERGFEDPSLFVQKMVVFTAVLWNKISPHPAFSELITKALAHPDMRIRLIIQDARDAYMQALSQTE